MWHWRCGASNRHKDVACSNADSQASKFACSYPRTTLSDLQTMGGQPQACAAPPAASKTLSSPPF